MREIKFRIYNDVSKEMYYMENPFWHSEYEMLAFNGEMKARGTSPLMQFTNIYDKNGKEIYEGDIVVVEGEYPFFDNNAPNYIAIIEWIDAGFCFTLRCVNSSKRGISDGIAEPLEYDHCFTVIGNIYENQELLPTVVKNGK